MANQIDNLTLNDDTSGFNRTVNVASDDLFLSVDLTLQSGAILTADNIKRGTADPNVALVAGNEGDEYQRTLAATGQLWINTDGTTTGWSQVQFVGGGTPPLADVLTAGNTTGGTDIEISSGDSIIGEPGGGSIAILAGSNTGLSGIGGNINIVAGDGGPLGTAGDVVLATGGLPAEPGDIHLNSSGAVLINPDAASTAQITGSSVLQFNERASMVGPPTIAAGEGRYWVRSDSPNVAMFTDDTGTDWVLNGPGAVDDLATVLVAGNVTSGTDIEVSSGDSVVGEANAGGNGGDLPITAGASTGGGGDGGDVILTPGAGNGGGVAGIVQANGVKHYANSTTNPTNPAPAEGDRYYNTALDMEMRYDSTRSKWLSTESFSFQSSDAGALTNGSYHQNGNVRFTATRGLTAHFNGTVVSLGYTRSDSDAASFQVTAGGTTVATLASSAISGQSTTLDGDFAQGAVLGTRNGGANSMSNSQVWVRVRWRV